MNKTAERLDLKHTIYDSPHGLSNYNNRSSALDIAKLSTHAMKIKKFREVVSTKQFINDEFCSKDVCVGSNHHHLYCDEPYLFYLVGFKI